MNIYTLSQIWNVAETAVYFSMPSKWSVANVRAKCVLKEVSGIEKLFVTVTFLVWAENGKLPLYMILSHKAIPNEQLHSGTIVRC